MENPNAPTNPKRLFLSTKDEGLLIHTAYYTELPDTHYLNIDEGPYQGDYVAMLVGVGTSGEGFVIYIPKEANHVTAFQLIYNLLIRYSSHLPLEGGYKKGGLIEGPGREPNELMTL